MQQTSVRDLCAIYLRHSQSTGLHGDEAYAERQRVLGWFVEQFGDMLIADLKPFHLSDWIEANDRWKSVATRRAKANCVRACFQWAADGERIDRNPFRSVRYAEAERRPELSDEDFEKIALSSNKPFERITRFLRFTG